MKKFKGIKSIKSLEASKLTKEQMSQANGGLKPKFGGTLGTKSICHIDGTDDIDFIQ
jgi:hypothetical protein